MSDAPLPPYGGDDVEYPERDAVLEKVVELALAGDKEAAIEYYASRLGRTRDEAAIFVEGF